MLRLFPLGSGFGLLGIRGSSLYLLAGLMLALTAATVFANYLQWQFGRRLRLAVANRGQRDFEEAWLNLRHSFRIWGALTILLVLLYIALIAYAILRTRGMLMTM